MGPGEERDGWKPGKTLFSIEEACEKATVIQMLVSDAAQKAIWPTVKKYLKPGDALYFSHGFSIVYKDQTKVIPPDFVDRCCWSLRRDRAPRCAVTSSTARASTRVFAVGQDYTGKAEETRDGPGYRRRFGLPFPDDL